MLAFRLYRSHHNGKDGINLGWWWNVHCSYFWVELTIRQKIHLPTQISEQLVGLDKGIIWS
jgi:hypothetical protein